MRYRQYHHLFIWTLLCGSAFLANAPTAMSQDAPYANEWQMIDSLEAQGLYRSALERTEALYRQATSDGRPAQQIKALFYQAGYVQELNEEGQLVAIRRLEAALDTAATPVRPVLASLLGGWYYSYWENHRWQLRERTAQTEDSGEDLTTWSGADFIRRGTELFLQSVEDVSTRRLPLDRFNALLHEGENTEGLLPTLYDYLVYQAIQHFDRAEAFLGEPNYIAILDREELLAPLGEFLAMEWPEAERESSTQRVLRLYQTALAWRALQGDAEALFDLNARRLQFAYQYTQASERHARYEAALQRLQAEQRGTAREAAVIFQRMRYLRERGYEYEEGNGSSFRWAWRDAVLLNEDLQERFPNTLAAKQGAGLAAQIRQPALSAQVEAVNLPGRHGLVGLSYTNVTHAYFRIVEIDENDYLERYNEDHFPRSILRRRAQQSWSEELPNPGDYREHRTETSFRPLPSGVYALVISNNEDFELEGGMLQVVPFWVSRLAVLNLQNQEANEILVADRITGAPIPGAQVQVWTGGNGNNSQWRPGPSYRADAQGLVRLDEMNNRVIRLRVQHGREVIYPRDQLYTYNSRSYRRDQYYTTFFLDRGIYRPGQTIHFKALLLRRDTGDISHIVPGEKITISLFDANGQEVDQLELTANAYGTAAGAFRAPEGRLLGRMSLRSSLGGGTSFRVEEYKRPRFEVEMEAMEEEPSLGDSVTLTGRALAYAGPALQGAQVNYVVERRVSFPWLPYWRRGSFPRPEAPYTLATGQTTTDEEGRFAVTFLAEPDDNLAGAHRPIYVYELSVDVTDVTGETHGGRKRIRLAEHPLQLRLNAPERHDRRSELPITIKSTNLDGRERPAGGTLTIERLDAPEQVFINRYWPRPDQPILRERAFQRHFPHLAFGQEDDPANWAVAERAWHEALNTGEKDSLRLKVSDWPAGHYRLRFQVITEDGDTLAAEQALQLFDWEAGAFPAGELLWTLPAKQSYQPGETTKLGLGTTAGQAFVLTEVWHRSGLRQRQWERPDPATPVRYTLDESDRGGLEVSLLSIRYNRLFTENVRWEVPWTNKELSLTLETFRDKLYPDQEETWRLRIDGPERDHVAAELVAAMYDASLDQIQPFDWSFGPYPTYVRAASWRGMLFHAETGRRRERNWWTVPEAPSIVYPRFLDRLSAMHFFHGRYQPRMLQTQRGELSPDADGVVAMEMQASAPPAPALAEGREMDLAAGKAAGEEPRGYEPEETAEREPAAPPTKVRTDLSETAFFFPQVTTDDEGRIVLNFRTPESLTRWKVQLFAHTKDLAYGLTQREVVTQKELMILPNAPRFLREEDRLSFTAKVSNLSERALNGTARLELFDPVSGADRTAEFGLADTERTFAIDPAQSAGLSWDLEVPDDAAGVLGYRVLARADNFADGEEAALPVLTNRVLLTDTKAFFVRGDENASFRLEALMDAEEETDHQSLTFELTGNPAWQAIKALPYLLEYPHECTEQLLNRYYANSLATNVVNRYPRLREVFEQWRRDSAALQSPLLANQDLKSALIAETPWVLEAKEESLQRERIALLFDLDRMATEMAVALDRLRGRQMDNGGFAWFPGGNSNWYVTQYVVETLAHLEALGIQPHGANAPESRILDRALRYIDGELRKHYERLSEQVADGKAKWEDDHLSSIVIHYLYVRSFLRDRLVEADLREITDYYLGQAEKYWLRKGLQEQAMLGLALHRYERSGAEGILASLRERALRSEELGMYWKYPRGYFWHQLPIETHALMIELFATMDAPASELDELRLWLLRNKETSRWETTKATAAAVYALLSVGADWLGESQAVQVSFPRANKRYYEEQLEAAEASAEAGTGYYQLRWVGEDVRSDLGMVRLRNRNEVPAWGGLYWQYFQDLDQVEALTDNPLQVERQLLRRVNEGQGDRLLPLTETPSPGDRIVVRLVIRTDRDMEFVHLKDLRASGLEPIEALSGYRWRDGLGFYQSITDVGTHFFFDYLPTGTYVLEYDLWATYRGDFASGMATLQCMYAPAFSSRSSGGRMEIGE